MSGTVGWGVTAGAAGRDLRDRPEKKVALGADWHRCGTLHRTQGDQRGFPQPLLLRLTSSSGMCALLGPLEPVPICFLLFFDRKLPEGQPRPHLSPALPLSSPLWTENTPRSPPATHPADMGTDRAVRLGSAILGLLLLQGKRPSPLFSSKSPLPHHRFPSREIPEPFHKGDQLAWRMGVTALVKQMLLGSVMVFSRVPHRVWPPKGGKWLS